MHLKFTKIILCRQQGFQESEAVLLMATVNVYYYRISQTHKMCKIRRERSSSLGFRLIVMRCYRSVHQNKCSGLLGGVREIHIASLQLCVCMVGGPLACLSEVNLWCCFYYLSLDPGDKTQLQKH